MKKISTILLEGEVRKKSYEISNRPIALKRYNIYNRAIDFTRQFLSNYTVGTTYNLKFNTLRNGSYNYKDELKQGDMEFELSISTISGVKIKANLVVPVRDGEFIEPSVIFINGNKRILAQSTFDDITRCGAFKRYLSKSPEDIVSKEVLKMYRNTFVPYISFGEFERE